jgi:hypothetical protein
VETDTDDTAAWARIEDVAACAARVDAQVRVVLGRVLAQRRSAEVASGYVSALSPGTKANCWSIAEAAGHEGWHRMQALLGSYRWDWRELRGELPALAAAWLPCDPGDLIGPGTSSATSSTATGTTPSQQTRPATRHARMKGINYCASAYVAAATTARSFHLAT